MKIYTLLNGKTLDLSGLSPAESAFLRDLRRMVEQDISYFEIERTAIGPGSPALRGRRTIDRRTAATPLYLAAEDIGTRAGIEQGLILAPEYEHLRGEFPTDASHISATQAADLIGISRVAVHKAIKAGTLQALHIGNVTVVDKKSAFEYRQRRESASRRDASSVSVTAFVYPQRRESASEMPGEPKEVSQRASPAAAKAKKIRVAERSARAAHG